MVARLVRDQEARGSNPRTPTSFLRLETLVLSLFCFVSGTFSSKSENVILQGVNRKCQQIEKNRSKTCFVGLSGTVFFPVVPFSSFPVFSPKTQESPAVCSVLSAGAILSGDPGGHKLPVYPVFALLCSYPCAVVFVPLCFPRFDLGSVLFLILPLLALGSLILAALYQFLCSLCGSRRLLCPPARQTTSTRASYRRSSSSSAGVKRDTILNTSPRSACPAPMPARTRLALLHRYALASRKSGNRP